MLIEIIAVGAVLGYFGVRAAMRRIRERAFECGRRKGQRKLLRRVLYEAAETSLSKVAPGHFVLKFVMREDGAEFVRIEIIAAVPNPQNQRIREVPLAGVTLFEENGMVTIESGEPNGSIQQFYRISDMLAALAGVVSARGDAVRDARGS